MTKVSIRHEIPHILNSQHLEEFFLSRAAFENVNVARPLLIAAHPDDETIGAGVLLRRRNNFRVVHVTEGSPSDPKDAVAAGCPSREAYAEARRNEVVEAMAMAGIPSDAITNLEFTDQQVAFHLKELTRRIAGIIDQVKPDIVLTHAYEGGHPDHDSVAFACHLAHRMRGIETAFALCEFTGYHMGKEGMEISRFLAGDEDGLFTYCLSPEEQEFKIRMINKFTTQARTLEPFLRPELETFRIAPHHNFTRPPHEGKLWYENFEWGVDGLSWRKMAAQTLSDFSHP